MAKVSTREVAEQVYLYRIDACGHAELFHTIEHGLRSEDIEDATLAALWAELEIAYDTFVTLKADICNMLHDEYCPTREHILP